MSIVHTLKKVVDPARAREEQAEQEKRQQERRQQGAAEPELYHCRVCGREVAQGGYCPDCLSDTMRPGPAPPELSGGGGGG